MTKRTPIERLLASACPRDTNGDGDCGQHLCPWCGTAPEIRAVRFRFVLSLIKAMAEDVWGDTRISVHALSVMDVRHRAAEEEPLMTMLGLNWGWEACVTDEWPGGPAEFLDEHLHYTRGSRHVDLIADLRDLAMMLDPDEEKYPGGKANVRPRAGVHCHPRSTVLTGLHANQRCHGTTGFHHAVADPNGVEYEGSREDFWLEVRETVERGVNSAYGTDPRHTLLATALADEIVYGKPIPWGLAKHFGQSDHMG